MFMSWSICRLNTCVVVRAHRQDDIYDIPDVVVYAANRVGSSTDIVVKYNSFKEYAQARSADRGVSDHFDLGGFAGAIGGFFEKGSNAQKLAAMFQGNAVNSASGTGSSQTNAARETSGNVMYMGKKELGVHTLTLKTHAVPKHFQPWFEAIVRKYPQTFESDEDKQTFREIFGKYPPFVVTEVTTGGSIATSAVVARDAKFEVELDFATQMKSSSTGIMFWKKTKTSASSSSASNAEQLFREQAILSTQIQGGDRTDFSNVDNWSAEDFGAWAKTVSEDPKVIGFRVTPMFVFIENRTQREATARAMLDFYTSQGTLAPAELEALRRSAQNQGAISTLQVQMKDATESLAEQTQRVLRAQQDHARAISKLGVGIGNCHWYTVNSGCYQSFCTLANQPTYKTGPWGNCVDSRKEVSCPPHRPLMAGVATTKKLSKYGEYWKSFDTLAGDILEVRCCAPAVTK